MTVPFRSARFGAALLLAAAIWMPAYTCAGYRAPSGELVTGIPAGADSSTYAPARIPHAPSEDFRWLDLDALATLLTYTWPLIFLGVRLRLGHRGRAIRWFEPPLLVITAWYIWVRGNPGATAYGTWVAHGALAVLFALVVAEFVLRRRYPDHP